MTEIPRTKTGGPFTRERLKTAGSSILVCWPDGRSIFSEKDAARTLGIPAGTVKSRLSRAKARLAQKVDANRPDTLQTEVSNEQ